MNKKLIKTNIGFDKDTRVYLDELKSELGKNNLGDVVKYLASYHQKPEDSSSLLKSDFSESQLEIIDEAIVNDGSDFKTIMVDGTIQRARYLNSIAEKRALLDSMSASDVKNATFRGIAKYRIKKMVDTVMKHNNSQPEKKNKVCLTRGIITKLTGCNRQTINKYFVNHEVMITDHNTKHELTDKNNRKGKGFSFHELVGVV